MVSRVDMFVYSSHEVSRETRCISIERNKNHTEIKAKQQQQEGELTKTPVQQQQQTW
jgi:hypothetical protein